MSAALGTGAPVKDTRLLVRPVRLLREWVSKGLTQADSSF